MEDSDLARVWEFIQETFVIQETEWTEADEAAFDAWVVEEIKNDPDCQEFIPASEVYAQLGIDLK